ncbi:MAG: DNA translocase FtsK [Planctomycetota bacterium]|jgi:S-DNA-T family DNA segregation ATPase FtsK/SpoIIIE|nr:DNA translocase FtsK [Planctomycetota bacterium]
MISTTNKTREISAVFLIGCGLFVLLSLLTHHPDDSTANLWPARVEMANACGRAGAVLSHHLFQWLGVTVYMGLGVLLAWGLVMLSAQRIDNPASKTLGTVIGLFCASAFASLQGAAQTVSYPTYGGVLGEWFTLTLTARFSTTGSYLVLLVISLISLALATETLLITLFLRFWLFAREQISALSSRCQESFHSMSCQVREALQARKDLKIAHREEIQAETARRLAQAEMRKAEAARTRAEAQEKGAEAEKRRAEAATLELEATRERNQIEKSRSKEVQSESRGIKKATGRIRKMLGFNSGEGEDGSTTKRPTAASSRFGSKNALPATEALARGLYELPPLSLLDEPEIVDHSKRRMDIRKKAQILEETLANFSIDAKVVGIDRGPVVTQYEIELAAGIKVTRVTGLADDLSMAMRAPSIRIQAPIPGRGTIGVEVPNVEKEVVRIKELAIESQKAIQSMHIPMFLGKETTGAALVTDLNKMPHLLIAGATGSGKSVCVNSLITSILLTRTPEEVKLILIDPKMVELADYKQIPHLMAPVITESCRAPAVLQWAVDKMDDRYRLLKQVGVRNITDYNKLGPEGIASRLEEQGEDPELLPGRLPFIVILIDELNDLMMQAGKEVENAIVRLAQKSRAVGMHLIVATQRPSADVITGLIKSNLPSRIAFKVSAKGESRIILDVNGAERLLGGGDMLFLAPGNGSPVRCQGSYLSDDEIRNTVEYIKQQATPEYNDELTGKKATSDTDPTQLDDFYIDAVKIVLETQRGSASLLQRKLEIGYSRASRLIDLMEDQGIVGPHKGSKSREILTTLESWSAEMGLDDD